MKEISRSYLLEVLGMMYLIGTKKGSHTSVEELWTNDRIDMPILQVP